MTEYDVVGIGGCLVDYFARVPKIIGPEEKINVAGVHIEAGGPTANNLVQSARLGLRAAWLGKIGDDDNGQIILNSFEENGLDTRTIEIVPGAKSAFTWIPVDQNGDRCIYIFANITKSISEEDVRNKFSEFIQKSRAFHTEVCQIPLKPIIAALEIAKRSGVNTLLDLDVDTGIFINNTKLGTEEELHTVIGLTNIIKASEGIALKWTGCRSVEGAVSELLSKGPTIVAITNGEHGSIIANSEEYHKIPAFNIEVVDTTGAGDAYMGGLSYGVLKDWPLEKIGRFASACGAICCTRVGAQQSGFINDVEHFLSKN